MKKPEMTVIHYQEADVIATSAAPPAPAFTYVGQVNETPLNALTPTEDN